MITHLYVKHLTASNSLQSGKLVDNCSRSCFVILEWRQENGVIFASD